MPDRMIEEKILKFSGVFERYVGSVEALDLPEDCGHFRKILYFTLLEALSKARYPGRNPHRAFSSFVVEIAKWKDGDRVSLVHLVSALARTTETRFHELRALANEEFDKWNPSGGHMEASLDLPRSQVQSKWPVDCDGKQLEIPEIGAKFCDFQHRNLLYSYRCKLTHESREPSMGFSDLDDLQMPYYDPIRSLRNGVVHWHLVYPSGFLSALCRRSVAGLAQVFCAQGKDPYRQFQFGHFLLDNLNRQS